MPDIRMESLIPTQFAVRCHGGCNGGGLIYLTHEAYMAQMMRPNALWVCPRCGEYATWDDDNFDLFEVEEEVP
jgi:hypothetical protein